MIELGASIISSTISTVLLYPAERVKIEIQLHTVKDNKEDYTKRFAEKQVTNLLELEQQQTSSEEEESSLTSSQESQRYMSNQQFEKTSINIKRQNNKNLSLKQTIEQIYKKHGWTGFYTGLQSLVIGNGLSYGVYFVLYEKCKNYLGFQSGSVLDTIKCSSIAGIGASIATNPFWVLQTKQTEQKGSILQKGRQLIRNQGFFALWKGISSSLILVSNPIIQFVIYEQLKKVIPVDKQSGLYDVIIFLIGAVSKMISTMCTYPLTVIRTKQHISVEKKPWRKIVKDILKSQGIKGLFKGIQPKLIQTVLNSALLLMLFERIRQILINYFASKA